MKIRVVLVSIVLGLLAQVQVSAQVIDCSCSSEYSVGDVVQRVADGTSGGPPVGTIGVVLCGTGSYSAGFDLYISWEGWDAGHNEVVLCQCQSGEDAEDDSHWAVVCTDVAPYTPIDCACDAEYGVGDRVTLLVDDPGGAIGLPAGTAGTVLCGSLEYGQLYVSWDGWSDGHNANSFCECGFGNHDLDSSHWWMSCGQVRAQQTFEVENAAEFYDALDEAEIGDIITMAPGNYYVNGDGSGVVVDEVITIIGSADDDGNPTTTFSALGSLDRVLLVSANATFQNLVFRDGTHQETGGAGARIEASATFTNCQFVHNSGTGAYVYEGDPTFNGCDFKYNDASGISNGGGIASEYGDFTMNECEVSYNAATSGGGIYANFCYHSLNTVLIKGNSALQDGAGIYEVGGAGSYNNVSIRKNGAHRDAGGVLLNGASPSFTDCTVSQNTASDDGGGFGCFNFAMPTFTGGEISDNVASDQGGGVYCYLSTFAIEDSSVCGNAPDHIWGAWYDLGGNDFSDACGDDDGPGLCPGDTNTDYSIDVLDLLYVIAVWGTDNPAGDINRDGWVDVMDLLEVIGNWGACNE